MKQNGDKFKVILSDCHLSAGKFFEGHRNPHEDFKADQEMCDLIEYFSTGVYDAFEDGTPVEVELVLGGDYFDFLNVPYHGDFVDEITEKVALYKLEAIFQGHPSVMSALKAFASKPGKSITYLIGNHDAELFYHCVQERITRKWDPDGAYPSQHVKVVADRDRLTYPQGFEIRHGNQLENGNELDFEEPFLKNREGNSILKLPWGSIYILKIVNRLKWEREHFDKIRPVKVMMFFSFLFDPIFTIRFMFFSSFYFLKTRVFSSSKSLWQKFKDWLETVRQETRFFLDLEYEAHEILRERPDLNTLIMGHTHRPMDKVYINGKQYINTGSWMRMVFLDWKGFGTQASRTFAFIKMQQDSAECELYQWKGQRGPCVPYEE